MRLIDLCCPLCNEVMQNNSTDSGTNRKTTSYDDCLRFCNSCEVAYANAQDDPTLIYKDPLKNIPEEVRDHLDEVASKSLNKQNRKTKEKRLGFSSSEDALTWTVFRYFQLKDQLPVVMQKMTGQPGKGNPLIYYWGVPLENDGTIAAEKQNGIVKTLIALGENEESLSEPDVILEDDKTIMIIEVKFGSSNDKSSADYKWQKYYLPDFYTKSIFDNPALKEYQLIRNWSIGNVLAQKSGKRFILVNLVFMDKDSDDLSAFTGTIQQTERAKFIRMDWHALLDDISLSEESQWLLSWLEMRKPKLILSGSKINNVNMQ